VWIEALGRAISFAYGKGEDRRLYVKTRLF
jgi:hypothetical protein